jgi:NADH:ubiquinone reductase (non-electrogenic)
VIAIGSKSNTFNTPGVKENCHFLKTVKHANKAYNTILSNLEKASLPTTTDEQKRNLLSFVVSGGGPTGVEFAAE